MKSLVGGGGCESHQTGTERGTCCTVGEEINITKLIKFACLYI